jgi:glycogen debranching enzyme
MPVVAPDLNTYLSIQQESLARIAELIGDSEGAEHFRLGGEQWTARMLGTLWDERRGIFEALHDGQPVPVLTPFALLPMWTGYLPPTVTERLLAHLTNRAEFWGEWPIPTVALNDPKFDPNTMWRGPTWPNINYLFVEALTRLGQHDLARKLRRKTLKLLMQHPDIYEYYNPLNADRPPKAAPIFGWSSAVFIDLAIQETELVQAGADH